MESFLCCRFDTAAYATSPSATHDQHHTHPVQAGAGVVRHFALHAAAEATQKKKTTKIRTPHSSTGKRHMHAPPHKTSAKHTFQFVVITTTVASPSQIFSPISSLLLVWVLCECVLCMVYTIVE